MLIGVVVTRNSPNSRRLTKTQYILYYVGIRRLFLSEHRGVRLFPFFTMKLLGNVVPYIATTLAVTQSYDFVIVGGGTAGLLLANRLSEEPKWTVAVVEAGGDASANPRVLIPGFFSAAAGSDLDWGFASVPQVSPFNYPKKNKTLALIAHWN